MLDEEKYEALWRRMTDVKTIKQWLRVRNPDFRGYSDREMVLYMMAGPEALCHNPLELHDDYKFKRDATVWLQLVTYVLPAEDDSNDNNNTDNTNDTNDNPKRHQRQRQHQ